MTKTKEIQSKCPISATNLSKNHSRKENQLYNTTQDERWKLEESSELSLDAVEHISDRQHRTALLVRKSR